MRNRYLLGAGVALAVTFGCAQANAQLFPGGAGTFYFGGEGGWTNLEDQSDRTTVLGTNYKAGVKFDDGYNVGARLGYQWGPWRLEEEYNYRYNGVHSVGGFGKPIFSGNRIAHAIMTNVLYDFTFGWPITPHLGAGIGAVDIVDTVNLNPVKIGGTTIGGSVHGNDWVFGYQAIAGIEYNINPNLALDLDYRYFATDDPSFNNRGSLTATPPGVSAAVPASYKSGYSTHNFMASLILRFGPPPAPPVAPPAAAPAPPPPPPHQVYLVFFDWDRYNITPEGMQIIRQAADHWRSGGRVRIEVTGYTDLSGPASYNLRLSQRRANAVAKALEGYGVPRSDMAVRGLGEANPRVPTAQGVREPQNRRVEIVFP